MKATNSFLHKYLYRLQTRCLLPDQNRVTHRSHNILAIEGMFSQLFSPVRACVQNPVKTRHIASAVVSQRLAAYLSNTSNTAGNKKRDLALITTAVAFASFGLSYAAIPLYRIFCTYLYSLTVLLTGLYTLDMVEQLK